MDTVHLSIEPMVTHDPLAILVIPTTMITATDFCRTVAKRRSGFPSPERLALVNRYLVVITGIEKARDYGQIYLQYHHLKDLTVFDSTNHE